MDDAGRGSQGGTQSGEADSTKSGASGGLGDKAEGPKKPAGWLSKLEAVLKPLAACGVLLLVLYCNRIGFLPTDVAIGDVIPLIIVVLVFAMSGLGHLIAFALLGAFVLSMLKAIRKSYQVLFLALALVVYPLERVIRPSRRSLLARGWYRLRAPSAAPVPLIVFLLSIPVAGVMAARYTISGSDLTDNLLASAVDLLQTATGSSTGRISFAIIAVACASIFAYCALIHFWRSSPIRTWIGLEPPLVFTSPLLKLFGYQYARDPKRADVYILAGLALVLALSYPGGMAGILKDSASATGIRRSNVNLVVMNDDGRMLRSLQPDMSCALYRRVIPETSTSSGDGKSDLKEANSIVLEGVNMDFHGLGKKSLLSLWSFNNLERIELKAENVRVVDSLTGSTVRSELISGALLVAAFTFAHLVVPDEYPENPLEKMASGDFNSWVQMPKALARALGSERAMTTIQQMWNGCLSQRIGVLLDLPS